jgi:hypothetical protein
MENITLEWTEPSTTVVGQFQGDHALGVFLWFRVFVATVQRSGAESRRDVRRIEHVR